MRYSSSLLLMLGASLRMVSAMSLAELLAAENTTLSTLNGLLAAQPALLQALTSAQNITILAPSNAAFNTFLATTGGMTAAADPNAVAGLLSYHVLNGTFLASAFTSDAQFLPTLLMDSKFTNVTGRQVVEGIKKDGKVEIISGLRETSVVQTADLKFTTGVLHIISSVLTLPITPSFTAVDSNLTALAGALSSTSLISTVDNLRDVTIFAPSNAAFQAIGSATGGLTTQQLSSILTYHVIQGTVGYSSLLMMGLANESLPTVNGADVKVLIEDGAVFVNSAKVILADVLIGNGVLHVIDNVLNPSNTTATPDPSLPTQAVAFAGAAEASTVPFTMGIVPTTTAPSASTNTNAAPGRREGAVGVGALLGAGAVGFVGAIL